MWILYPMAVLMLEIALASEGEESLYTGGGHEWKEEDKKGEEKAAGGKRGEGTWHEEVIHVYVRFHNWSPW